jgi:hypothetical protein
MDNLDKFFDSYDRMMPRWFGDFLAAALVFGPLMLVML